MYNLDPFAVEQQKFQAPPSSPMTIEDIERRRQAIKSLGMKGTGVDRVNDMAGSVVQQRDMIKEQANGWVRSQLGMSGGGSGGGSAVKDTATKAIASQGMTAAGAAL